MGKRLSLKAETLASLTAGDLAGVAGAAAVPTTPVEHCLAYSVLICYTRGTTCAC